MLMWRLWVPALAGASGLWGAEVTRIVAPVAGLVTVDACAKDNHDRGCMNISTSNKHQRSFEDRTSGGWMLHYISCIHLKPRLYPSGVRKHMFAMITNVGFGGCQRSAKSCIANMQTCAQHQTGKMTESLKKIKHNNHIFARCILHRKVLQLV